MIVVLTVVCGALRGTFAPLWWRLWRHQLTAFTCDGMYVLVETAGGCVRATQLCSRIAAADCFASSEAAVRGLM